MSESKIAKVHSIETFGSADGPGVRFVLFLQGCAMRCQFCHNPDTWAPENEETKLMSSEEILNFALRYRSFWREKGGITVSGGEPLLQIDFLCDFFARAKAEGVNTCLDTSGQPFSRNTEYLAKFDKLMNVCDLFMLDIKEIDDAKHTALTGHTNKNILDMAMYLEENQKNMWIRHVLVPGGSDNDESLHNLRDFIAPLKYVKRVDVLPYHVLGKYKWEKLGMKYPLEEVNPPTDERVLNARTILCCDDYLK